MAVPWCFPTRAPGPAGDETPQIVLLDLRTGERRPLTHLPPVLEPQALPAIALLTFLDDTTLGFEYLDPYGEAHAGKVRTDGSGRIEELPEVPSIPGGSPDPSFRITGDQPSAGFISFPEKQALGPPAQHGFPLGPSEIFLRDGDNLLQLTYFGRADTIPTGSPLSWDGQRVFFIASADPLGENPTNNCQIFSINRLGGDLRQVSSFREATRPNAFNGCTITRRKPEGCFVFLAAQDPVTQSLVFRSTCDPPLGTNPNGQQVFAIRPDGTGLRQLTNFAGLVRQADGTLSGEGVGALAFGPSPR